MQEYRLVWRKKGSKKSLWKKRYRNMTGDEKNKLKEY